MKRQGRDVIDLSVGEPDFSTPDHIKEAAARAMRNEATKYTALDGTIELKVAIQEKFRRENNISYGLNEVTVLAGAKQILFNALMASLNIGDEVIIPTSAWVRIPISSRLLAVNLCLCRVAKKMVSDLHLRTSTERSHRALGGSF